LSVALDAGVKVSEMVSVNHQIRQHSDGENRAVVQLDSNDSIPNKDFVLRWKVAGDKVKSGLFVQRDKDGKGGHFTLMIVPPESLRSLPRRAVEMVFVVDTSGSMSGAPIEQAKSAVQVALTKMQKGDTFQVVKFDSSASRMAESPLSATPENLSAASRFVKQMSGGGGTEMLKGINMALNFPHDDNRTRVVAFLTDGYIGNEVEILKALHRQLEDSRVFSFGVGASVNRYLLDSMAVIGHGNAAYLSINEPAKPVMDAYFERISHPALANVSINWGSMHVTDVYPRKLPELFVGRPIIVTGRFTGEIGGDVTVSGKAGGEVMHFGLPSEKRVSENPAIATVWARMKIADLENEAIYEDKDVSMDVRQVALTHGLMSAFTSFVAVDSTRPTEGDHGTTVGVAVPVPEGVRYDTTIQERK
jgi:Ca-activated chloride channel family protein